MAKKAARKTKSKIVTAAWKLFYNYTRRRACNLC